MNRLTRNGFKTIDQVNAVGAGGKHGGWCHQELSLWSCDYCRSNWVGDGLSVCCCKQVLAEFLCGLVAIRTVFRHGAKHDLIQFCTNSRVELARRNHCLGNVLIGNRNRALALEWRASCQKFVKNYTG